MERYNPPREPKPENFPGISREEFMYIRDIWLEEYEDYRIKWKMNKGNKEK